MQIVPIVGLASGTSKTLVIMKLQDAIALIQHDGFNKNERQQWADLGCGTGLFTHALATYLFKGSTIFAVDKDVNDLKKINSSASVTLKTIPADFITEPLPFTGLHGIVMANSLHYVKDKTSFIDKVSRCMLTNSPFLIVEYDSDRPVSTWVPYPVSYQSLVKIFSEAGYSSIIKLHEHPSVYHNGTIYSAWIKR